MDHQVHGADGRLSGQERIGPKGQGRGQASREHGVRRAPPDVGELQGPQPGLEMQALHLEVAEHDVWHRAALLDVWDRRQPLAYESVQVSRSIPLSMPQRRHDPLQPDIDSEVDRREQRHRQAEAPVLDPEHHQDTDGQQDSPKHGDDELGEEVREPFDVAVDPLYQLPRRAGVVKAHVEAQHVQNDVRPEPVGRPPRDILTQVLSQCRHDVNRQPHAQEESGRRIQLAQVPLLLGEVDEVADELRVGYVQGYPRQEQDRQERHPARVWQQVSPEQR